MRDSRCNGAVVRVSGSIAAGCEYGGVLLSLKQGPRISSRGSTHFKDWQAARVRRESAKHVRDQATLPLLARCPYY
jgi:hypothetical protein